MTFSQKLLSRSSLVAVALLAPAAAHAQGVGYTLGAIISGGGGSGTPIPQNALASRPSSGTVGALYYATDKKELFRDNGSSWDLVTNIESGNTASRPSAGVAGRLYVDTQASSVSFDTGAGWTAISGGGGGITALTGDGTVSGSSGSVTFTLKNTGTAGTYFSVTTDAQGRVISGAALSSANVTTALGFTPYSNANPSGYITSSALSPYALTSALSVYALSSSLSSYATVSSLSGYAALGSASTFTASPVVPTLSYGDASAKAINAAYGQANFASQFNNNPIVLGSFPTIVGVTPPPTGSTAAIFTTDSKQWNYFSNSASINTSALANSGATSIVLTGTGLGLSAGLFPQGSASLPAGVTIQGAPVESAGNTTINLSAALTASISSGTALMFGQYLVQPTPASSITGVVPTANLPVASTTGPGILTKYDATFFDNGPAGFTCAVGKCVTPDGTTVAILNSTISAVRPGPVCSNTATYGDNGGATAGYQYALRRVFYCPQGATGLQLKYPGVTTDGSTPPNEVNIGTPVLRTISIEPSVPAPWNPGTTYAIGALVSFAPTNGTGSAATYAYNPYFVALAGSTGVFPTPNNSSTWGPAPAAVPIRVTCEGADACAQRTSITNTGAVITRSLATDWMQISVPVGGYIAVREMVMVPYGTVRLGSNQSIYAGGYTSFGANTGDQTLSGNRLATNPASNLGPFAIVGLPVNPTPSVCVLGDSRTVGLAGNGISGITVTSGGTNYNVGDILTNNDAGASADNVISSAKFLVQATSSNPGPITTLAILDPGHYAIPGTGGQTTTNPTGTQTPTGGAGSGATITITALSSSAGAYEDTTTLAPGGISAGLNAAGIPNMQIGRSSDRISQWIAQGGSKGRLNLIREAGCTSVIDALDYNDTNAAVAPATTMASHVTLAQQILGLGVRGVYLVTTPPGTKRLDKLLGQPDDADTPHEQ